MAVVVEQLLEQLLLRPEIRGSNPDLGNLLQDSASLMQCLYMIIARPDQLGEYRLVTDQDRLAPDCSPIHPKLLGKVV